VALKDPAVGAQVTPSKPLSASIDFSNLYHLRINRINYLFEHLDFPKLRTLNTNYSGGIEKLGPIAPRIKKLVLRRENYSYTVTHGCAVPFINLVELVIRRVPTGHSSSHLLLAPNLKSLHISDWIGTWDLRPGYMLSPDGMLGPIHALTRLRLQNSVLSHRSQPNYCTYHLRFHPHLKSLTFIDCHLPKDFLELMLKPLDTTDEFLPSLEELAFEDCQEPSKEWLEKLAIVRPQLDCSKKSSEGV
jgi:hypothetical protein